MCKFYSNYLTTQIVDDNFMTASRNEGPVLNFLSVNHYYLYLLQITFEGHRFTICHIPDMLILLYIFEIQLNGIPYFKLLHVYKVFSAFTDRFVLASQFKSDMLLKRKRA